MSGNQGLFDKIYQVVFQIPRGKVATYGQIADIVGPPCDARRVGWAMASLGNRKDVPPVPWQRVVGAGGRISMPGPEQKEQLIQEGVEFDEKERINMERFGWKYDSFGWKNSSY